MGRYQDDYELQDVDEDGLVVYTGFLNDRGIWFIKKIDKTTGTTIRWAGIGNNSSYANYSNAWDNRESLTYSYYNEI